MTDSPNSSPTSPDAARLRRTLRRLLLLLWIFLGTMAVLAVAWKSSRTVTDSSARLPVVKEVPDFSLQNRDGSTVDLKRLEGKPWVADFVFTSCPGICPILTEKMSVLAADLPADEVHLVSFSVDPETDTPEVLQAYAEERGAGDNWLFLTGPVEHMYSVVREGFLLVLDPAPARNSSPAEGPDGIAPEPIVHSNRFVLVDARNRIRGYYNAFDEAELRQLRTDLELLLR